MNDNQPSLDVLTLTADIVAAHVSNNSVPVDDLPAFIASVGGALLALTNPAPAEETKPVGAVSIRASLASREHIISMLDGKPYKMLKRHIGLHGYTPERYRETFGLRPDYPMTAPAYADRRRALALEIGLGRNPNQRRGRHKKAA